MSQRMPPVQYIMTGVSPGRPRSGAGTAPPAASVGVWQKWSCKTIKQFSRPGNAQLVAALATLWVNVRPRADTPLEQACALANLETAMPRTLAEWPRGGRTSSGRSEPAKCPASHSYALRTSSTTGRGGAAPAACASASGGCAARAPPAPPAAPARAGAASRSIACHALGASGRARACARRPAGCSCGACLPGEVQ